MVLQTGQVSHLLYRCRQIFVNNLRDPSSFFDWIIIIAKRKYHCFSKAENEFSSSWFKALIQEINELDSSGFKTNEPTIFAGNIGGNSHIVQVVQHHVLLLKDNVLVQTLPVGKRRRGGEGITFVFILKCTIPVDSNVSSRSGQFEEKLWKNL